MAWLSTALRGKAFGIPLEDFAVLVDSESEVPYIVEQCCSFIFQCGMALMEFFLSHGVAKKLNASRFADRGNFPNHARSQFGGEGPAIVRRRFVFFCSCGV